MAQSRRGIYYSVLLTNCVQIRVLSTVVRNKKQKKHYNPFQTVAEIGSGTGRREFKCAGKGRSPSQPYIGEFKDVLQVG